MIDDYEVAWARGFGLREAGLPDPIDPHILFQAGSVSKPIFALAVMRLVQEGILDLDEDGNAYLTSWKIPARASWQPRVTLRRILSHSAGLTVHGFPGYQVDEPLPTLVQVLNGEAPANNQKVQVNLLPGLTTRYSGWGTVVAQQVLVDVLKQPFPEIMHDLVLTPLGMADSTYEQPLPPARRAQAATAHPWKGVPLRGKYHVYPEMAPAGLWTTAADLAKAGSALLKTVTGKSESGFLSRETIQSMIAAQLPGQKSGEGGYAGLGFFCEGKGRGLYFGHNGWDEGFVALWELFPVVGKGLALVVNSNEGNELFPEIWRAIGTEYGWPDVYPPEKAVLPVDRAGRYAGVYLSAEGAAFTIGVGDSSLAFGWENQPDLPLYAAAPLEFFAKSVTLTVKFEENADGQIARLILTQDGKDFVAEKQADLGA